MYQNGISSHPRYSGNVKRTNTPQTSPSVPNTITHFDSSTFVIVFTV